MAEIKEEEEFTMPIIILNQNPIGTIKDNETRLKCGRQKGKNLLGSGVQSPVTGELCQSPMEIKSPLALSINQSPRKISITSEVKEFRKIPGNAFTQDARTASGEINESDAKADTKKVEEGKMLQSFEAVAQKYKENFGPDESPASFYVDDSPEAKARSEAKSYVSNLLKVTEVRARVKLLQQLRQQQSQQCLIIRALEKQLQSENDVNKLPDK
eukprot:TRINITY_DN856_c0_g2_i2.p1 TRINITY_DN856_c0_g2~~TRINITY_DN856_c0_g2_i2.p1  ORF type:complete len:214 (+),score=22.41 TRINITY_DN856_c0_g2_i2:70-711(+)